MRLEVVSQYPSPDGRLKAVVFVQGCGATVRDVTEFSILTANADAPKGSGNALVIKDDPAHPVQQSPDGIELRVKWNSSNSLSVLFPRAAIVEKRSTGINGVSIEYGTF